MTYRLSGPGSTSLRRYVALGWVSLLVVLSAACTSDDEPPQADGPNILVILSDDQRDDVTGMTALRQWLGDGGTRFTNTFATTPLCCPSRASIFSGRYAHNHGVQSNTTPENLDQSRTIQRYLRRAGYRTGLIGKYLNTWPVEQAPPNFTDFAMFGDGYIDEQFNIDGEVREVKGYTTDIVRDFATQMLTEWERNDDRPWFLFLSPYAPHSPYRAADRYRDDPLPVWEPEPSVREEDRSDKPPWVKKQHEAKRGSRHAGYQIRNLYALDDLIDEVMVKLGLLGERRETLVFFLSDNGYLWGDHGLLGKGPPYTASVKIPMFVRWPGHFEEGAVDRRMVANIDVPATILDASGVEPGAPIDGRSLLSDHRRDHILLEYWEYKWHVPSWASIRTPDAQYVEYYDDAGEVTFTEFYDLERDPWQLENLLATGGVSSERVEELAQMLEAERGCEVGSCP